MSIYYYAAFIPIQNSYAIVVPDLPEVASQGNTIPECMEMASEAVALAVAEYAKCQKKLPAPSDMAQAKARVESELKAMGENTPENLIMPLILAQDVDLTPVKISISVPRAVLDNIDQKAKNHNMTRSGFLVEAAQSFG